jgi:hypothetical protein
VFVLYPANLDFETITLLDRVHCGAQIGGSGNEIDVMIRVVVLFKHCHLYIRTRLLKIQHVHISEY